MRRRFPIEPKTPTSIFLPLRLWGILIGCDFAIIFLPGVFCRALVCVGGDGAGVDAEFDEDGCNGYIGGGDDAGSDLDDSGFDSYDDGVLLSDGDYRFLGDSFIVVVVVA